MSPSRLALVCLCFLFPLEPPLAAQSAEPLLPGPAHGLSLASGQAQTFSVVVGESPLLVQVEQRGLDLVVEAHGPGRRSLATDAGDTRWGPEILVLEGAGPWRVEVRSKAASGRAGSGSIAVLPVEGDAADSVDLSAEKRVALRAGWTAMSRGGLAAHASSQEGRHQALESYRSALSTWRELGERRSEADALTRAALVEQAASDPKGAAVDYEQAVAIWRELGEGEREAAAQNELGLTRLVTGSYDAARAALARALEIWRTRNLPFDEAEAQSNLCLLEQTVGNLSAALACYAGPLATFRATDDQTNEGRILNNIGGVYDLLGDPDAALDHYQRALALRRGLGDSVGEAQVLNNIAVIRRTLGDWQEALRLYGAEREILRQSGDPSLEAPLLNNVGYTYNSLGEPRRAIAFLEEALELRRRIGDRRGEVVTLNNLGIARRKLGEIDVALKIHRQAREQAAALNDSRQEALSRLRIAEALLAGGDFAAALEELEPAAAALKSADMRQGELRALELRGEALLRSGRASDAVPVLRNALSGRRELRDRGGEAGTLVTLATAERAAGDSSAAQVHADEAVKRAEELRSGFASPDLRAAFLATQRRAYSLLIDLLMARHAAEPQGNWDRAALAVSERARARSLLDALGADRLGGEKVAIAPELLARRKALRHRLASKADQQLKQQSGSKAEALGQEIDTLVADLDGVEGEIRRADPRYAAFSQPPPVELEDIAKLLEPGTVLLEFALGEKKSYLWAVSGGELHTFPLPPEREIEALARQVYEEMNSLVVRKAARLGADEARARLSAMLLGGAWSRIGSASRWVVVPDGALHFLAFSALPAPDLSGGPLLERLEIDFLPSATTLILQRRRPARVKAARRAAVFADPVFSPTDPRVAPRPLASSELESQGAAAPGSPPTSGQEHAARGHSSSVFLPVFKRLPFSRREADAIASFFPPGEVWVVRDFAANREAALSTTMAEFRVVHFATHAVADTRTAELSGLILSQVDHEGRSREGFVGLSDIYDLHLNADLVVLSGCRTAIGKEVRGEGLMGLTRGFLFAGVPRVVGSLFSVPDRTAAELMTRFYRALWQKGQNPASALREAQRDLRRDPRYREPFYWAGYVLQGDWR